MMYFLEFNASGLLVDVPKHCDFCKSFETLMATGFGRTTSKVLSFNHMNHY